MDDPKLYYEAHEVQRQDAADIIDEFASKIQWRTDGLDALIDIGSGPGDVVSDFIYPRMPPTFQRIVWTDIKASMVEYAKSNYGHLANTDFKVLNIETYKKLTSDLRGQFDHVTSNYCLQLVVDQRQAFCNIYNLLRPEGGDILINHAPYVSVFDGYISLSKNEKWSPYMQDIEKFTSPLQNVEDPRQYMLDLLRDIGFCDCFVETRDRDHLYTLDAFRSNMKAISPYIHRVPIEKHDEFIDDYIEAMANLNWHFPLLNRTDNTFRMPYRQMVIYARKPNSIN